jgi:hypothetical protein
VSVAAKAALTSSVLFILFLVGWNYLTTQHRSITDSFTYSLWVVPLFVLIALLNWLSIIAVKSFTSAPLAMGAVAFVLVFGLTILLSQATRSLGGQMTPMQIGVTAAFAAFNAACLFAFLVSSKAGI